MDGPVNKKIVDMSGFDRSEYVVSGVRTAVYSIGSGRPVVYLHGGGTFPGFDFVREWARDRRVIVPYHPGFGESDDDPRIDDIGDYIFHYIDLFNQMGLDEVDIVAHSLGAWIAAEYASVQAPRIGRLVLVAPNGVVIPEFPNPDSFKIPKEQLHEYLTADPSVALRYFPDDHDIDFLTLGFRELTAFSRVGWEYPQGNPKLRQRIHLITCPTLLLWGQEDRFFPVGGAKTWQELLPKSELRILRKTGHLVLGENPDAPGIVHEFLTR